MAASLDVGLLGPLEVRLGDEQVVVAAPKQRKLLALLALDVGRVVSADELADRLWSGNPPDSAATALQVYISQLRKLLGAGAIVTRRPGYLLDLAPDAVDTVRFERLVADGRSLLASGDADSAEAVLTEALSGWRGDALAEFVYEDWAAAPVRRLEELRLVALEDRVEAQLVLGQGAELTGELEGLVGEHPLRERLRGQQMLALYRAGRQADALSAYQEARRALVDELGIDPSPALVELERRILRQDSSLIPTVAEPVVAAPVAPAAMPSALPSYEEVSAPLVSLQCAQCGASVAPTSKFCAECAAPIGQAVERERQQRKLVTVLFCDMVGSTALGERLDAEVLREVMNRYFDAASAVISKHGGSVEKFIGDAVVAVFGIPLIHEDDALRAVRAAAEIRTAIALLGEETEASWGVPVQTRIGVSTGEVVVGDDRSGHAVVTGDTMNLAARLEQAAHPGEVFVGDVTWQLVRDAVVGDDVDPLVVKGKAEPVTAHRLVDVVRGASGHARRMDLPLVGRESERRLLFESYERWVAERACGVVTILGTAGVGKSRLVAEALAELEGRARIAAGRCVSYGSGITYWPLAEAIRQLAGIEEEQTPGEVRASLARVVDGRAQADSIVEGVAALMGVEGSTAAPNEMKWAVRGLLEQVAAERPLVVVLDDLQWAETPLLDLVDQLADTINAPVLLLCVARPELLDHRSDWGGGKLNATTILLEPLDSAHTDELVSQLMGGRSVPDVLRVRVASAAAGNPLFAEELLAYLQERGHITLTDDGVEVRAVLEELELPPTIRALIGARLDQLPEQERSVLERGAVEGEVFHAGAIAVLSPASVDGRPGGALQRLVRKQVIRPDQAQLPGQDAYRFRHLLIRDATYDAIPKQQRADWHQQFAEWLELIVGERASEYEEILAHHYAACYGFRAELGTGDEELRDRATVLLRRSADRALTQTDLENAAILLARLAQILPPEDENRVVALADRAVAQAFTVGSQAATATVEQASEEVVGGSREAQIYVEAVAAWCAMYLAPGPATDRHRMAAEEASAAGWHRAAAMAWMIVVIHDLYALRIRDTAAAVANARRHADAGLPWLDSTISMHDALLCVYGSLPIAEAIPRCDGIFERASGDPALRAVCSDSLGWLSTMGGDYEAGMAHFAQAASRDVAGAPSAGILYRGIAHVYLGLPEVALVDLFATRRLYAEIEMHSPLPAAGVAHAFAQLDRAQEAAEWLKKAEDDQGIEMQADVLLCGARARLLSRSGDHAKARAEATRGVQLTTGTDSSETSGLALIDLAWVSLRAGSQEQAHDAAKRAVDILGRRGAIPMRDIAQSILDEAARPVTTAKSASE
jgi:class 3 adenylate cyclase/DNA-binding SARP family transcriptional activator